MFSTTSNTHRYLNHNMMMERSDFDGGDDGKGDALWRTAVAYIAYGDPILKEAIIKSFRKFDMINRKNKYWYQGSRAWNRYREDDVSRDQIILALASLKFNGDDEELKELVDHLPKKLSRRFRGSFVMRYWMKAISRDSRWYTFWFHFWEMSTFVPSVFINKLLRPLAGRAKTYDAEWMLSVDPSIPFWHQSWDVPNPPQWVEVTDPTKFTWVNNSHRLANNYQYRVSKNKLLKFLNTIMYPSYALHLTSWMTQVSGKSFLKQLLQQYILWEAEKDNLLIRKMMGRTVTQEEIDEYRPIKNYRWSSRMDQSNSFYLLEGDDAIYNTLDKDLLVKLNTKY